LAVLVPLGFMIAALFIRYSDQLDDRIRLAGLCLNVLGLIVVAVELARTQGEFKGKDADGLRSGFRLALESMIGWTRDYTKSFPTRFRFRDIVINAGSAGSINVAGQAAIVSTGVVGQQTLEQRIELLEARQKEDRAALSDTWRELRETTRRLDTFQANADGRHRELQQRLEGFATGGIPAQAMGWTWLLFGTIMDGASEELGWLLKPLLQLTF
jgi:hypothetical protein